MFNRTTRNTRNRNTRTKWERCSHLTRNTPERHHWCCSVVFRCLSENVLKTDWEDVFSVTFFCLPRRLQDIISRCLLEDVLKMSWRRLEEDVLNVLKTSLEEVLQTRLEDVLKNSWRPLEYVLEDEKLLRWRWRCLLGWLLI